jgi:Mn-dependent DtxR family transcriptional regulator
MTTVLQATREQLHRLQEHLRRAWDDRDAAKVAHVADRERLRRLVAAVRAYVESCPAMYPPAEASVEERELRDALEACEGAE